jgi:hypothetical protein
MNKPPPERVVLTGYVIERGVWPFKPPQEYVAIKLTTGETVYVSPQAIKK